MKIELSSKEKGNLTELQCLTAFYELGYKASIPYGENSRYDFILDIDGILLRIQVKTCQVTNTGIKIPCRSSRANANACYNYGYDKEQIDYFATYYNGHCYLVKVEECSAEKTLVFSNKRTNQYAPSFIDDYLLEKQIAKIKSGEDEVILEERKIYQYDLRNNLVNTYSSCREAAEALGNASYNAHISQVVRGVRKTAYGYKWTDTLIKG